MCLSVRTFQLVCIIWLWPILIHFISVSRNQLRFDRCLKVRVVQVRFDLCQHHVSAGESGGYLLC